jgi:low affinity Fe/Cu permease
MNEQTQSFANHRRLYPLYHYFALPILYANIVMTLVYAYRHPGTIKWNLWQIIVAMALAVAVLVLRASTIIVQNRLIRLEQRMRLAATLPDRLRARVPELTISQLIGLRFASDAELPALVERCLSGDLKGAEDVKRAITTWQPDYLRA